MGCRGVLDVDGVVFSERCGTTRGPVAAFNAKYASIGATANSLNNPGWGAAEQWDVADGRRKWLALPEALALPRAPGVALASSSIAACS
jgi:hypothetical protein